MCGLENVYFFKSLEKSNPCLQLTTVQRSYTLLTLVFKYLIDKILRENNNSVFFFLSILGFSTISFSVKITALQNKHPKPMLWV